MEAILYDRILMNVSLALTGKDKEEENVPQTFQSPFPHLLED
jgi:hypothetical protein